jgi:UDP-2,3-diacylglucosamine pyrophosphatase LpxH
MTATTPKRLTVIADFHMSAPAYDDFVEDRAAAAFLDHLAAKPANRSLLILGDLIDFAKVPVDRRRRLDTSSQAALRKLEVVAAEHERVFAALGRLAAAGVALELVAGNHDAELVRPPVQEQLGRLLGEAAGAPPATVSVHPWIYHLPGLLYAEHGHQHHDINRTPELFDPASLERGGSLAVPLGTHIADYQLELEQTLGEGRPAPTEPRRALAAGRSTARFAGHAANAALRAWLAARRGPPRPSLTALADNLALPPDALHEIASICPTGPRDLLTRALRRPAPDPMRVTAARIDQILSRRGIGAHLYIFGHTHRAAHTPLHPGAAAPLYLNPGTWSVLRPAFAPPHLTFLELTLDGRGPDARLIRWEHAEARPRPVDAHPAPATCVA